MEKEERVREREKEREREKDRENKRKRERERVREREREREREMVSQTRRTYRVLMKRQHCSCKMYRLKFICHTLILAPLDGKS